MEVNGMNKKIIGIAGVIIAIIIAIIAVFALKGDKENPNVDNSKNMTGGVKDGKF